MGTHHDVTGFPLYVTTFVELRYSLLETREEVMEGRRALDCRKNVEDLLYARTYAKYFRYITMYNPEDDPSLGTFIMNSILWMRVLKI